MKVAQRLIKESKSVTVVSVRVSYKRNLKRYAVEDESSKRDLFSFSGIFHRDNGALSAYAVSRCIRYHLPSRVKFYPPFIIMLLVTQFFLYSFYKWTHWRSIKPYALGVKSMQTLNVLKSGLSRSRTSSWRLSTPLSGSRRPLAM